MAELKTKQKKVRVLNQKGKVFRQQDPLLAVVQWGVHHMLNEVYCVPEQPLILERDYKASSKIHVQNHMYNDQVLPSKYKVKEYCPQVFRSLRKRFNEDPEEFLSSIVDGPLELSESAGRSHSQFLHTYDHRLVLKMLTKEEVSQFHHTFTKYYDYIVEHGAETLLPRYLDMYRITVHDKDTYLIVMNNIMSSPLEIHRVYDLKGSTVERHASDKELAKALPTLKDNDFTTRAEKLFLGGDRERVLEMLQRDTKLLQSCKLMDYSLLVAIHSYDGEVPALDRELHRTCFGDGSHNSLYFVGLIDGLTNYSAKKRAAHAAKTAKHGRAEFSTVNPEQYARRLVEFIESNSA